MQVTAPTIMPCLWFDSEAEDAAKFYASVFKDAKIGNTSRFGKEQCCTPDCRRAWLHVSRQRRDVSRAGPESTGSQRTTAR